MYRRVETNTLNVRDADDAGAAVIGFLKPGDQVEVVQIRNGWALVSFTTNREVITDPSADKFSAKVQVSSLWIRPGDFAQEPERITELASTLEMDDDTLTQKLARSDQQSWNLMRYMDSAHATALDEQQIRGVHLLREYWSARQPANAANSEPATGWVLAKFLSQPLRSEPGGLPTLAGPANSQTHQNMPE
jgi:hypothetical protein